MSWGLFVHGIPADVKSMADLPDDFEPSVIGRRTDIIAAIKQVAPFADFSDPSWGLISAPDFSIEVSLGEEESLNGFALHVRGDDQAIGLVIDIIEQLEQLKSGCSVRRLAGRLVFVGLRGRKPLHLSLMRSRPTRI